MFWSYLNTYSTKTYRHRTQTNMLSNLRLDLLSRKANLHSTSQLTEVWNEYMPLPQALLAAELEFC